MQNPLSNPTLYADNFANTLQATVMQTLRQTPPKNPHSETPMNSPSRKSLLLKFPNSRVYTVKTKTWNTNKGSKWEHCEGTKTVQQWRALNYVEGSNRKRQQQRRRRYRVTETQSKRDTKWWNSARRWALMEGYKRFGEEKPTWPQVHRGRQRSRTTFQAYPSTGWAGPTLG
jgi:hypothetical protein